MRLKISAVFLAPVVYERLIVARLPTRCPDSVKLFMTQDTREP